MLTALKRLKQVSTVILVYQLYEYLPQGLTRAVIKRLSFWVRPVLADQPLATRLREALQSLGPVAVKFGQMLSTRHDILTPEMANELAKLQDRVPGFDPEQARQIIETELQAPLEACFEAFDTQPLASASVAQIHTAMLKTPHQEMPKSVVIKVIRPGIQAIILKDLSLMSAMATLLHTLVPGCRSLHLKQLVRDYRDIILDELDLSLEAANAQRFADNFRGSNLLYVPKVYWPYVTSRIMVSERIQGVPVNDIQALTQAGVSLELLAERGAEIFFTQVFRDNFFHADMHPGNIYVDIRQPEQPKYIALDCAIVGQLSEQDQWLLGRQLIALMDQDYQGLAKLMILAGWVSKQTPLVPFAKAIERVCKPIFSKPLSEIEFGKLLTQLFATARAFNLQSLPQLMLLEKTLLHVEGLGRQLYPDLDIWQIGRPLLNNWYRSNYGIERLIRATEKNLPLLLTYLPKVPELLVNKLETQVIESGYDQNQRASKPSLRRLLGTLSLIFAMITAYHPQQGFLGWNAPMISYLAAGLGIYWLTSLVNTTDIHRDSP